MLRQYFVGRIGAGLMGMFCFLSASGFAEVLRLDGEKIEFKANSDGDLRRLSERVEVILRQEKEKPKGPGKDAKKLKRGLQEIQRLAGEIPGLPTGPARVEDVRLLQEMVAAINNSQRPPVPTHIDQIQVPFILLREFHRPVGRGEHLATNLAPGPRDDLSKLDPLPSSFWSRPTNIAGLDLYHGFGRDEMLPMAGKIWQYAAPKESYGMNPGFEVASGGPRVKLKFGEVSSEPLAARIFAALGFHADPTDYAGEVRVRYDRRIFMEFNSRKELKIRFTLLWVLPLHSLKIQKHYDPFNYIAWAALRDGRRWTGRELKRELFRDVHCDHPEEAATNFRTEVETNIDYLITVAANVQEKEPSVKSIGPWDPGQLDHADRREVRAAGLLAAWLGFYDTRVDNTKIKLVRRNGREELLHFYSDLGSGLGQTSGFFLNHGEQPNAFTWTFTQPPLWQGRGHLALPLRVEGYRPLEYNPAFAAMTIDDARWMARLIGQLTGPQIVEALVGSGYDSGEVRLYTEKLLSRRDRMILDLGLASEIPLCRPGRVDRYFSYDPVKDGPVRIKNGAQAPTSDRQIIDGRLVSGLGRNASSY